MKTITLNFKGRNVIDIYNVEGLYISDSSKLISISFEEESDFRQAYFQLKKFGVQKFKPNGLAISNEGVSVKINFDDEIYY